MADEYDNVAPLSNQEQSLSVIVDNEIQTAVDGVLPAITVTAERETVDLTALQNSYVSRPTQVYQTTFENPLLDYTTVNYNLSLHLLSHQQLDSVLENPTQTYVPKNVLVAGAGRYQDIARNSNFKEDFYFDDFRMDTFINISARNRTSNLIECRFTIIEPLGFTLINRLIAASRSVGESNYIEQPYMLQIDFFAGSDSGTTIASALNEYKKYIPIRIVELKSRITNKGTEYDISAVPYNHHALSYIHVTSPANFRIRADSVADAFGDGSLATQELTSLIEANQREKDLAAAQQSLSQATNESSINYYLNKVNELKAAGVSNKSYIETGYTNALNTWNTELIKGKQKTVVCNYKVIFSSEIGQAKLFSSAAEIATTQSVTEAGNASSANKSEIGITATQLSWTGGVLNIPKGTKLDELINFVVRASNYVTEEISDPLAGSKPRDNRKPFKWFRIIPKIKKQNYDPATQTTTYSIIYYVRPWTVNSKHPYVTNGKAQGYVKEYDYIFTGKNRDVLDLQIDFNTLYYTQLQSMRYQDTLGVNALVAQNVNQAVATGNKEGLIPTQSSVVIPCQDDVLKVPIYYTSEDNSLQTVPSTSAVKQASAADLQRSLTVGANGDMINVKLKILGDPHLIKQDDIFYGQSLDSGQTNSIFTPNNSIYTDDGELYVKLNIKTPIDYNDRLGLTVTGAYDYNAFSGIYKIIKIENNFIKGRFEQTLDLARIIDASYCPAYAVSPTEAYASALVGQLPTTSTITRFAGPAILLNNLAQGGDLSLSGFPARLQALALGALESQIQQAANVIVSGVTGLVSNASDFISDIFSPSDYEEGFVDAANNYGFGDLSDVAINSPNFDFGSTFQDLGDDFFV